jgi:hypothetical protein
MIVFGDSSLLIKQDDTISRAESVTGIRLPDRDAIALASRVIGKRQPSNQQRSNTRTTSD